MASIISVKNRYTDGKVTSLQLETNWKGYPPDLRPKLLSLLERFDVAFRLKTEENVVFIPCLLSNDRPGNFKVKIL